MTRREPSNRTLVAAELALLLLTVVTIAGYARLFDDWSFLGPACLAAVLAHVLAAVLRRAGVGPVVSLAVGLLALPLVITWVRYGGTTSRLLPTSATLDRVGDDLDGAWQLFVDHAAPVPAVPGFVALTMVAAWLVALVSDALAFRLHTTVEALAPAAGLFLFASILSGPHDRVAATAAFLAAALGFTLAARVARADDSGRWLATDAGRGARSLLVGGSALTGLAVVVAVVAGPLLPGGDGEALLDVDGDRGGGGRVTVSPLVDIHARLVEQSDVEVFRVRSPAPAYWRLTALDDFDGRIWSSSGSFTEAEGGLPETPPPDNSDTRLSQSFRISNLAQIWLPAAFTPISVHSPDARVDWEAESATLVVGQHRETSDGLRYDVVSLLPNLAPSDLATGTAGLDREFVAHYTALPPEAEPIAARYAAEAVGSQTTAYGRALALQDFFRHGFTYSLDVPPGQDTDALAAFLDPRNGRAGYCEQFAGAYAALARSLGLPARVAVGFTPGEQDPDEPGTFVVRGRHAHAWPELYFAGQGWVPFEPTPGRGAPNAEAYTGVTFEQVDQQAPTAPTTATAPAPTGSAPRRPTQAPELAIPGGGRGVTDDGPDAVTVAGWALAGLAGLWLIGVPTVGGLRRLRRNRRARGHPDLEVTAAWDDSVRALAVIQVVPRPAETPIEFATRSSAEVGTDGAAHGELAELVTAAAYGTARPDVERARRDARAVRGRALRLAGPWRRLRALVSPRHQLR